MKAFDLTYSWSIYDALDPLLKGKRPATLLDQIFRNEYLQFPTGALRMRFNTNHDKNAWDAPAVLKFGPEGLRLSAVLINTIPGVPMIYTGEEVANDKELGLFEKVDVDWNRSSDMKELYKKLFQMRKQHKALSRGEMIRAVSSQDQDVYAFFRVAGNDKVLVLLNFSSEPRYTSISVPMETIFPGEKMVTMKEIFTDSRVEFTTETSPQVILTLEPYGYRIFVP